MEDTRSGSPNQTDAASDSSEIYQSNAYVSKFDIYTLTIMFSTQEYPTTVLKLADLSHEFVLMDRLEGHSPSPHIACVEWRIRSN